MTKYIIDSDALNKIIQLLNNNSPKKLDITLLSNYETNLKEIEPDKFKVLTIHEHGYGRTPSGDIFCEHSEFLHTINLKEVK